MRSSVPELFALVVAVIHISLNLSRDEKELVIVDYIFDRNQCGKGDPTRWRSVPWSARGKGQIAGAPRALIHCLERVSSNQSHVQTQAKMLCIGFLEQDNNFYSSQSFPWVVLNLIFFSDRKGLEDCDQEHRV
ncbi:hypothetical protein QYF61_002336 [Mycteria americana]|uniref:Uncharacterized protein n=1 Tax=Mycteria americana TaxID=33587 RepID=A0AAN7PGG9_MYCAM|nr:hypothetical protein QYF61_002336 [Mycteria americana]